MVAALGIGLAGGGVAGRTVRLRTTPTLTPTPVPEIVYVVVAGISIQAGAAIPSEAVFLAPWAGAFYREGDYFINVEAVVGRTAYVDIAWGEPILTSMLEGMEGVRDQASCPPSRRGVDDPTYLDTPIPTVTPGTLTGLAYVSDVQGEVAANNPLYDFWARLEQNTRVLPGTTLHTGQPGCAKIEFGAHSFVRAGPQTQLSLSHLDRTEAKSEVEFQLEYGRLWGAVDETENKQFAVRTPFGIFSAVTAFFSLEHDPVSGMEVVTCLEGECQYMDQTGSYSLTSGEQVAIGANQSPGTVTRIDPTQLAGWNPSFIPEVLMLTPAP